MAAREIPAGDRAAHRGVIDNPGAVMAERKLLLVLLQKLMEQLILRLPADVLKRFVDMFLDWAENLVEKTKTQLDDITILPMCRLVRNTFDIPDNDPAR
jgi:hypothetical protein